MSEFIFDPMAKVFCEDPSLEVAERTGLAIREAAKYCHISFNSYILPTASCSVEHGATSVHFSSGLGYDFGRAKHLAEEYPEHKEECERYTQIMRAHHVASRDALRSVQHNMIRDDDAEWAGGWGGHSNPDFGRIANIGTEGIRAHLNECREKNKGNDCDWFYRGCEYALEALEILGDRFHDLAVKMAEECTDEADKKRYEDAAKAFEVVPRKPAYDFTSACHAFWMHFTFDGIDSPGRFDQYMWRAYEITENKEEADDALRRVWEAFHRTRSWNLCLSGSDENWNDKTNELTYKILALAAEKKYHTPNITLRVHRNTPEKLWQAIADTLAFGIGMPALYNDEIVCPALEMVGIPACDSHLYCMNGCNQIDIMAKSHMGLEDGEVIFAKCLEYALYDGHNGLGNGERHGLPTGDAKKFKTYAELENAFYRQLDYVTYVCCATANAHQHQRAIYEANPFRSCFIDGCLEKGIDYRNGGPLYGHGQILAEAIADTGDSLWAIKKLVFDEGKYTMEQLIDALVANFEGYDELYHDFSNCEKFGNDIECVDEITTKALNRFFTFLKRNHTYRGGVYMGGCSPFSRAAGYGHSIGSLPNGKKRGECLIADCIGAVPGCDENGPTALMKSTLKYNHIDSGSGFIFHTKFEKKLLNTSKGKATLIALAKTYFAGGGQQFTATVVDPEELLDAQKNPDKHRDLIVRVGGYSDIFVNLDKGLQDNVIARTFTEI